MTKVTLTKAIGGHAQGDTIDTTPGAAAFLTNAGYADTSDDKTARRTRKPKTDEDEQTDTE
jgi:hypothetical protein